MKTIPVYVGLDYRKDSVQVRALEGAGRVVRKGSYENDALVMATTAERHGTEMHAAIESCAGAADLADALARRGVWTINLAHPG